MGRIQKLKKQRKDVRKELRKTAEEFQKNIQPEDFLRQPPKFFLFKWIFGLMAYLILKKK